MGREGVRFVIDEIQGIQRFEKIKILPTRLVIRKSTQLFRNYENKERLAALIT
jgi:DNA-binding LacI/PurR family transcriptional regulator